MNGRYSASSGLADKLDKIHVADEGVVRENYGSHFRVKECTYRVIAFSGFALSIDRQTPVVNLSLLWDVHRRTSNWLQRVFSAVKEKDPCGWVDETVLYSLFLAATTHSTDDKRGKSPEKWASRTPKPQSWLGEGERGSAGGEPHSDNRCASGSYADISRIVVTFFFPG